MAIKNAEYLVAMMRWIRAYRESSEYPREEASDHYVSYEARSLRGMVSLAQKGEEYKKNTYDGNEALSIAMAMLIDTVTKIDAMDPTNCLTIAARDGILAAMEVIASRMGLEDILYIDEQLGAFE